MFLKYFSTNDFDLNSSFYNGLNKIKKLSKFQKFMTYFWILGPFIFLIERDPADLWLTLISITFLIRCFYKKDWNWVGQLWFIFAFLFWIISMISGILGPYDKYSFFQGFIWIRFPLYVAAAQVWLGKDKDVRIVMFISILIGMIIMCLILLAEIIFEPLNEIGNKKERLSWPYGDFVPGSYLAKISLPVYCTFLALITFKFKRFSILSLFISLTSLTLVLSTGERGNFLIRLFSGILAFFSWEKNKRKLVKSFIVFISFIFIIVLSFLGFKKNNYDRYVTHFFESVPIINTSDDNTYWGAWRSGMQQGLIKPIIGLGPSSSRKHCKTMPEKGISWLPGKNYCGNHPHNFYIQIFAETGLIGLTLGVLMFYFLFATCYKGRLTNPKCPISSICYIIPLAFFFPFQQTGSFFGQWGNLFIWFPIGFCIAHIQDYKSIFKK